MSSARPHDHENEITLFGETNFRNQKRRFGIKTDDRRRHMYVIGKTGMGKTTLLENLIQSDINAGHGCCYIDPHGDTAEKILDFIPPSRINDVVYFNPSDIEYPVGFNILETDSDEQKPLVASGLMGVFKKIWPDVWSARMEYILMNCVLALLDYPGATLMGINRLLVDKEYRERVVAKIRDPIVKTFWVAEYASWSEKYATEAIAPVQNKVGQFLSSAVIRNIVAQVKSTVNLRRIMDDEKILIINLSKGRIGEDSMRLLGGMLITKIQLAAQERQNIPEKDRRDFYLFVDEFQNFANESFASILSEARKYRLNLIVAHQYIEQLDEKVTPAIFGNVGTIISMRVGAADAEAMETEFMPTFTPEDLVNLAKFQMYLKLMVDGVATSPFSANTLAPISVNTGSQPTVIAQSRERYAEPRAVIEEKVLKWSGMEAVTAAVLAPPALPTKTGEDLEALEALESSKSSIEYPAIKTEEELEKAAADTSEYLRIRPERMAAIKSFVASSQQAQKQSKKPAFKHTCSRCGKTWELAIQLDPSRPMFCAECRPIVAEERKNRQKEGRSFRKNPLPPEGGAEAAPLDLGEGGFTAKSQAPNRPRVIRSDDRPLPPMPPEEEEEQDLLSAIIKAKGGPVELRKQVLEKQAGEPLPASPQKGEEMQKRRKRGGRGRKKDETEISRASQPSPQALQSPAPSSQRKVAPGERITFDT
ncbi:MAG: type IV secretion system DNA-binding domain-containing protein [Candidatus Uhrbacteria bacterium]|nr:type IV secretion system DNA-binding domain-containing protein [Candidatus Uhrbacteria bacterium]